MERKVCILCTREGHLSHACPRWKEYKESK